MSCSTAAKVTPSNLRASALWVRRYHQALAAFEAEAVEEAPGPERSAR